MNLTRLRAITIKELWHITRDLRTFLLVIVSPPLLLLIMSYIFGLEVKHVYLGVMDFDRSALSRRLVQEVTADGEFTVNIEVADYDHAYQALRRGEANLVLVIPAGFASKVARGEEVTLQAIVDGMDPLEAPQITSNLEARVKAFVESAQASSPNLRLPLPSILSRAWYNPGLKSKNSMVPGIMAIVLTLPAMALALAVAREAEVGTFEGLIVSPLRGSEYLLGKLLAYVGTGFISAFLTLGIAVLWFHIPFRGDLLSFVLLTLDFFFASMGVGLLIGQTIKSQQATMFITLLYFIVPSFFIAGLILPISEESPFNLLTSYALCTTHFIAVCRGLTLKGMKLLELAKPAISMAFMGMVSTLLSIITFRKKLG